MLTQAIEDYLKIIYKLQCEEQSVTTNAVAERMGVAAPSASNMIKKLAGLRLVEHTPYRGVVLTNGGEKIALEVIRHHRLLELYLSQHLGVRLDRLHEEAERLEHVISEDLEEKIAAALGEPTRDPHGDPIPSREGILDDRSYPLLADLDAGERAVIVRVSDRDPRILNDLAAEGLLPGTRVHIMDVAEDGSIRLRAGEAEAQVPRFLAEAVYVAAAEEQSRP
ncbi:MAG: metal-dependent transcriptional regulator [Candidatus Omnitrophota bacterium]|nr:metal-dependent transcriptional regulator [Candidatus Omnitrophota bacterium]